MPVARAGDARAQVMVGMMYANGEGTTQNHAEAAKWIRIAANQGLAIAQSLLGNLYVLGQGIAKDYTEAARWFRFAAEQGYADAQSTLGLMYAHGVGLPQDDVLAYMWLNLAAARSPSGEERRHTVELRDEVAARLSQAERARVQGLVRKWQPRLAARPEGESRAAIWAFQADIGLRVDGQFSDELIAALREAAASGQRVAARPAPAQPKSDGIAPWERYRAAAAPTQRRLDSTGSGFAISRSGHILTNHHVVAGCAEVRVQLPGREAATAVVIAGDPANDLALLEATVGLPAAELRHDSGIRPGDSVVAVGFPLHGVLASVANVTTGTVSALAGIGNDARFMQMTVPVQPGSSGGPLLDLQGRVVGVVVSKLDALRVASVTGDIPQNVNFAIKADVVRTFLHASNVPLTLSLEQARAILSPAPQELSPAVVGAQAQKFTVLVECWK